MKNSHREFNFASVCVCVRERERERERKTDQRERGVEGSYWLKTERVLERNEMESYYRIYIVGETRAVFSSSFLAGELERNYAMKCVSVCYGVTEWLR